MTTTVIVGLDIGGANLKAADSHGSARTVPFALWKEPDRLPDMLRDLLASLPPADDLAVTITGELCDCFASKHEGVLAILAAVEEVFRGANVVVWTNQGRFRRSGAGPSGKHNMWRRRTGWPWRRVPRNCTHGEAGTADRHRLDNDGHYSPVAGVPQPARPSPIRTVCTIGSWSTAACGERRCAPCLDYRRRRSCSRPRWMFA